MSQQNRSTHRKKKNSNPSICALVRLRQHGRCHRQFFEQGIQRFFEHRAMLLDPEIVSPHRKAISSLSVDKSDRFILAGSDDATLSIYDISKWGSEAFVKQEDEDHPNTNSRRSAYPPVARSQKNFINDTTAPSPLEVPVGHATSVTYVAWYPVDTGIFFSSAQDGKILLWDTNKMLPVMMMKPFVDDASTHGATSIQPGGSLIATGSRMEAGIKLVDIRSGSHSHELSGHDAGISAIQWSSSSNTVFASGSRDGSIRLWDIRKSGSSACITVLNREDTSEPKSFRSDYSHLRPKKQKKRKGGPNSYRHLQSMVVKSHGSFVSGLSFLNGGQTLASVGGSDGELLLWDLRSGIPDNARFRAPGGLEACTPKANKAALHVTSGASSIWVGHKTSVLGFSRDGGSPTQTLEGHIDYVTCIERIGMDLVVGSKDGMITCWGADLHNTEARTRSLEPNEGDQDNW